MLKLTASAGVEKSTTPVAPSGIIHAVPAGMPPENCAVVGSVPSTKGCVPVPIGKSAFVVTGGCCVTVGKSPKSTLPSLSQAVINAERRIVVAAENPQKLLRTFMIYTLR